MLTDGGRVAGGGGTSVRARRHADRAAVRGPSNDRRRPRPRAARDQRVVDEHVARLREVLRAYDARLGGGREYLAGDVDGIVHTLDVMDCDVADDISVSVMSSFAKDIVPLPEQQPWLLPAQPEPANGNVVIRPMPQPSFGFVLSSFLSFKNVLSLSIDAAFLLRSFNIVGRGSENWCYFCFLKFPWPPPVQHILRLPSKNSMGIDIFIWLHQCSFECLGMQNELLWCVLLSFRVVRFSSGVSNSAAMLTRRTAQICEVQILFTSYWNCIFSVPSGRLSTRGHLFWSFGGQGQLILTDLGHICLAYEIDTPSSTPLFTGDAKNWMAKRLFRCSNIAALKYALFPDGRKSQAAHNMLTWLGCNQISMHELAEHFLSQGVVMLFRCYVAKFPAAVWLIQAAGCVYIQHNECEEMLFLGFYLLISQHIQNLVQVSLEHCFIISKGFVQLIIGAHISSNNEDVGLFASRPEVSQFESLLADSICYMPFFLTCAAGGRMAASLFQFDNIATTTKALVCADLTTRLDCNWTSMQTVVVAQLPPESGHAALLPLSWLSFTITGGHTAVRCSDVFLKLPSHSSYQEETELQLSGALCLIALIVGFEHKNIGEDFHFQKLIFIHHGNDIVYIQQSFASCHLVMKSQAQGLRAETFLMLASLIGHDIQEVCASKEDLIQFPWDPGILFLHRLGGKPQLKKGGMSGCYSCWAGYSLCEAVGRVGKPFRPNQVEGKQYKKGAADQAVRHPADDRRRPRPARRGRARRGAEGGAARVRRAAGGRARVPRWRRRHARRPRARRVHAHARGVHGVRGAGGGAPQRQGLVGTPGGQARRPEGHRAHGRLLDSRGNGKCAGPGPCFCHRLESEFVNGSFINHRLRTYIPIVYKNE